MSPPASVLAGLEVGTYRDVQEGQIKLHPPADDPSICDSDINANNRMHHLQDHLVDQHVTPINVPHVGIVTDWWQPDSSQAAVPDDWGHKHHPHVRWQQSDSFVARAPVGHHHWWRGYTYHERQPFDLTWAEPFYFYSPRLSPCSCSSGLGGTALAPGSSSVYMWICNYRLLSPSCFYCVAVIPIKAVVEHLLDPALKYSVKLMMSISSISYNATNRNKTEVITFTNSNVLHKSTRHEFVSWLAYQFSLGRSMSSVYWVL